MDHPIKDADSSLIVLDDATVRVSPVGLRVSGEITFDDWASIGPVLGGYTRAIAWAIGDWLNFGERRWGEMYAQAMDTTGLSLGRLRNLKYLASAVPMSVRNPDLSLSHHEAVAPLSRERQQKLLRMAYDFELNRDEIRSVVKELEAGSELSEVEDQIIIEKDTATNEQIAEKAREVARTFSREYAGVWPGSSMLWQDLTELCELVGEDWHGKT